MIENIRLAFRGILSHKMRSFLTMLGIIIGIAAIIAIVSTIKGTNEQIKMNLVGSGSSNVQVMLYQGDWTYETEYNGVPEGVPQMTESILEELRSIKNVSDVASYYYREVYEGVSYLTTSLSGGYIYGIDTNYLSLCGYTVMEGRAITQRDIDQKLKVAVLDKESANTLFAGEDAVGKTIEIKGEPFTVIGVVEEMNSYEPTINSVEDYYTYSYSYGSKVYIPESAWAIVYNFDEPQNVVLKVNSVDDMTDVGKAAAEILNSYVTSEDDTLTYKAIDLMEQAKEIQQLSEATNRMLLFIAGISLLVGGIGVMNIMLVSVTERTSEIGLKKAIGARKGKLMHQFLTEAAVLTSIGGIFGVIVGIVLAQVISRISETPVAISVPAALLAVVFSMFIGILFGLLPARKAANLDPVEALRRE